MAKEANPVNATNIVIMSISLIIIIINDNDSYLYFIIHMIYLFYMYFWWLRGNLGCWRELTIMLAWLQILQWNLDLTKTLGTSQIC